MFPNFKTKKHLTSIFTLLLLLANACNSGVGGR
jgi:hypothetical protein